MKSLNLKKEEFKKWFLERVLTPHKLPIQEHTILTIGSFDGIHRGHLLLIEETIKLAREKKTKAVLVTFVPHPRRVLQGYKTFKVLTTLREKIEILKNLELDYVCLIPFTQKLASLTAENFLLNYLLKGLNPLGIIIGFNFRFGRNRKGDIELLKKFGEKLGFFAKALGPVKIDGLIVSSSTIRELISKGEIEKANHLLGRPYFFYGKVIKGLGLGKKLGFPTANLEVPYYKFVPPRGVYAVKIEIQNSQFLGAMNIGIKPTLGEKLKETIEIHIFDFNQNIYHQEIRVEIFKKIREEKKFSNLEELKRQIEADCEQIRKFFASYFTST